ncbi:MAG: cation:proton antiporter [Chthoniobacterales bacterium]|jgi:monovalent cation:H+ antiporter-2, CPA2 family|nr:cation:proton antiporter [Chthoniobacterales bacterium]
MPHETDIIVTIASGLAAAMAGGFIMQRIGLPPIVGYLLAGVAVGPFTPGFVADAGIAAQCAEIGVILLMFGVGLHFHLSDLLAVRRIAIPGAVVQIAVATGLGALSMRFFGWDWPAGVVFGMAISVASTVVLTRVLTENQALSTPTGHIAMGWLIVEDLFTVAVLVALPALHESGGQGGVVASLGWAGLKLVALVVLAALAGRKLIPWLLGYIARTCPRELFTLAVLALALGIAVVSAKVFGASMALGAFLAGMIVGQSEYSTRAASEAMPMRDAFAVLFFVSVGMLFHPRSLVTDWPLILVTTGIVLVGKPLAAFCLVLLLQKPLKMALAVSAALAQIGEFSFILASLACALGVLPGNALTVLVAVAVISITLNPLLYKMVDPVAAWMGRRGFGPSEPKTGEGPVTKGADHVVVVGHGPVGRAVCRLLREHGLSPVVVEMNIETVQGLKQAGQQAVYGDAARPDVLEHSGVAAAKGLIITASGLAHADIIREARRLNPGIRVLARSVYLREASILKEAGADAVFSGELETALAMTAHLLDELGAPKERVKMEREKLLKELG